MARCLVVALLALACLAGTTAGAGARREPACFGAAARDREHPCHNRRLRLVVEPTPDQAQLQPNLACVRGQVTATVTDCAYGAAAATATQTVALLGDSHAAHWRAAMDYVGQRMGWRVLEIATPHCPFSLAMPNFGEPGSSACLRWNQEVLEWLDQNPSIATVFVSANTRAPVVSPPGWTARTTRVDGYLRAWAALPVSVTRLIVIRDTPTERFDTHDCVRRAIAARRPAASRCALRRAEALAPDAEVLAARLAPRRPPVIDLTSYFCSRRRCFPVVGGVLVHKDGDHMTQLFARTLGPYLLRRVNRVIG
jgi:hypothetical protein